MNRRSPPKVLTIAGSDSGGGAGIQADLKTFASLGCYGMSAITAITAQNTLEVRSVETISVNAVCDQIDAVIEDIGADAVKTGMLCNAGIIEAVADRLKSHNVTNLVVDPVMVSTSGHALIDPDAAECLKEKLFPLASVITPNIPEALNLTAMESLLDTEACCRSLADFKSDFILLKGGHASEQTITDTLLNCSNDQFQLFRHPRIDTPNTHGTGCTLASAIAAFLAKGLSMEESVESAESFLIQTLLAGARFKIGNGHGAVHHHFNWWS